MSKIQQNLFKVLAVIAPVFLVADLLRALPFGWDTMRTIGFVVAPLLSTVIFILVRKNLDREAKILGWFNMAFVAYQAIALVMWVALAPF